MATFVEDLRHPASPPSLSASPISKPLKPLSPASQQRMGSLSPGSIPSSPNSVHSSSSAIFERDIEPLPPALAPHHHTSHHLASPSSAPHRTPRARASEPLDQAVPNVLMSAAAVLSAPASGDDPFAPPADIAIIAPAHILPTSALPSPVATPSPTTAHAPLPPLLPGPASRGSPALAPASPPAPALRELPTAPSVHDQTSTAGAEERARNRLSFVSYNDLLLSAPVGTVPLAAITQPASAAPPPHLPSVEHATSPGGAPSLSPASRPRSVRASMLLDKDLGGEWEREGLGRGLEERLEALLCAEPTPIRPAVETA